MRSIYLKMERLYNFNLSIRRTRYRNRLASQGVPKTTTKDLTLLETVSLDGKTRKAFDEILTEKEG